MEDHKHEERAKDQHHTHNDVVDGLSEDLQGFYGELTKKFPNIRVTSGRRTKSPSGGFSHHFHGDAIDIGREHTDVYDYLYNTQEGLGLMSKYGLGILDETDPATLKKTGGTGPHFHIGKDSGLYSATASRVGNYENIQAKHSFISQNPAYDYRRPSKGQVTNNDLGYNMSITSAIQGSVGGVDLILPNSTASQMFMADIETEKKKNEIVEEKVKASPERDRLQALQLAKEARHNNILQTLSNIRQRDSAPITPVDNSVPEEQSQSVGVPTQTELGDLPDIFTYE